MSKSVIEVSATDADLLTVESLYIATCGYPMLSRSLYLHIAIAKRMGLATTKPYVIDHIDGNRYNNKRDNLRSIHNTDNVRRRHRVGANNGSGYAGVSFVFRKDTTLTRPWFAKITVNRKQIHLGYYRTKIEAASAYAAVAEFAFGAFAPTTVLPTELRNQEAVENGLALYRKKL